MNEELGTLCEEELPPAGVVAADAVRGPRAPSPARHGAILVAAGILLSRIAGLVRQRVFAKYFGVSDAADAFNAAFRIPNFLQNLFGEGVLSASFIPVYAGLRARGEDDEAERVAGAVAAILALITSAIVLIGILVTPMLIALIAPGFEGEKRAATISLVRVLFPGAGILVCSAWCLAILNSHRKFFMSYTAPVLWNLAMIAAMIFGRSSAGEYALAGILAWGSVAGSAIQFGIQVPPVLRLLGAPRFSLSRGSAHVRQVVENFFPVFVSRGVVQISAYVDSLLASLLGTGAVAGLAYAQQLYTLPVSLFGMAISAAELPEMASATGTPEEVARYLRERLESALDMISYLIVPSAMGFLALGDVVAAALYQTGKFGRAESEYVWGILAGSAVGLLASTLGRIYSSTFYALHDTRTPLRFAVIRVALTTVLGYLCAIPLPPLLGLDPRWGAAGLTASAGAAGWVEFVMLRAALNRRIGRIDQHAARLALLWVSAIVAAIVGLLFKRQCTDLHPILAATVVLLPYVAIYAALAKIFAGARPPGWNRTY